MGKHKKEHPKKNSFVSFRKEYVDIVTSLIYKYKRYTKDFDLLDLLSDQERTKSLGENLKRLLEEKEEKNLTETPQELSERVFLSFFSPFFDIEGAVKKFGISTVVSDFKIIEQYSFHLNFIDSSPCFYLGNFTQERKITFKDYQSIETSSYNPKREKLVAETKIKTLSQGIVLVGEIDVSPSVKNIPCVIFCPGKEYCEDEYETSNFISVFVKKPNDLLYTIFYEAMYNKEDDSISFINQSYMCKNCRGYKADDADYCNKCKVTNYNRKHCFFCLGLNPQYIFRLSNYVLNRFKNRKKAYPKKEAIPIEKVGAAENDKKDLDQLQILKREFIEGQGSPYEKVSFVPIRDYTKAEYSHKGTKHTFHKSPAEHYRRGTIRHLKSGKEVEVKPSIVNKGKTDHKIIYDMKE